MEKSFDPFSKRKNMINFKLEYVYIYIMRVDIHMHMYTYMYILCTYENIKCAPSGKLWKSMVVSRQENDLRIVNCHGLWYSVGVQDKRALPIADFNW